MIKRSNKTTKQRNNKGTKNKAKQSKIGDVTIQQRKEAIKQLSKIGKIGDISKTGDTININSVLID